MRVLGWLLLGCLLLTALRWAVALFVVAILFWVTIALIRKTVETLSVLFGWFLLNAFAAHPALGLLLFVLLVLCRKLSG